jgi:hypothetical protein
LLVIGWWLLVGGWWLVGKGKGERGTGNSYQEEEADNHCNSACISSCLLPVIGWWLVANSNNQELITKN